MLLSPTTTKDEMSGTGGFDVSKGTSANFASFLFRFLSRFPFEGAAYFKRCCPIGESILQELGYFASFGSIRFMPTCIEVQGEYLAALD